jgi:predicted O-methyltransferase YrrM
MKFTFDLKNEFEYEKHRQLLYGLRNVWGGAIDGHIAEFGTMSGRSASILAEGLSFYLDERAEKDIKHKIKPRKLYLFDSFLGLPEAEEEADILAPEVKTGIWGRSTCKGLTAEQLRSKLNSFLPDDKIIIHEGWFEDTLPTLPNDIQFAFVHIDCDLYKSTLDILNYLFNNEALADGAMLFFDDWNSNYASYKFGQRRAWNESTEKYNIKYSDCGEYAGTSWKFIIHK